jgi:hypothetical protein
MFLISLEPVAFFAASLLENCTCLGRGVCMKCRGKKCALDISRTAPNRHTCIGSGVRLTFTKGGIQENLGSSDVEAFLTHLAVDEHVSAFTQNQAHDLALSDIPCPATPGYFEIRPLPLYCRPILVFPH